MSGIVTAAIAFDDGSGSALFVGGEFVSTDNIVTNRIAKWDGSTWSSLEGGTNGEVNALEVFNDGSGPALYAAGKFSQAGGISVSNIAKWNGQVWTPLGSGLAGTIESLEVFDDGNGPALFAAGSLGSAGDVARWDGQAWTFVGNGVDDANDTVLVLRAVSGNNPGLYAGGKFTTIDGVDTNKIARWDGMSWSPVGLGFDNTVSALEVHNDGSGDALYAGGSFTIAGGSAAKSVAKWNGSTWSPLGTGANYFVSSLVSYDDGSGQELYASGIFTVAGGLSARRVAKWNGNEWSRLGSGMDNWVATLTVFDEGDGQALFAGGSFTHAGSVQANRIARWDGSSWSAMTGVEAGIGMNRAIYALEALDLGDGDGPTLYAGGSFTSAGGAPANHIAKWNGRQWESLGVGTSDAIFALAVFDDDGPALFAGGHFDFAGGLNASNIAKWDGASWSALGSGVDSIVEALATYDDGDGDALYVGGGFTTAGGVSANRIARWDGASWAPLGSGLDFEVEALMVHDDGSGSALFVGGNFVTAGGVPAANVAKWNGKAWSPVGSLPNGIVFDLAEHDDGNGLALYAAGLVGEGNVVKWDGESWNELGGGISSFVYSLTSHLSATGSDLFAGGWFNTAQGHQANLIARWDGSTWSELGSGLIGDNPFANVDALVSFGAGNESDLFVGGLFSASHDLASAHLARWSCTGSPDIFVSKTNGASQITAGSETEYDIFVENISAEDGVAMVLDQWPGMLTCSWTSQANGGATGHSNGSGSAIHDTLSMPAGSEVTYSVDCLVASDATGQITNTATVTAPGDPDTSNNMATDIDTVIQESDVAVTVTNGTTDVTIGSSATYSLEVTNHGPSDTTGVSLVDGFPSALQSCRWQSVAEGGASGHSSGHGNALVDTLTLPAGSTVHYAITCAASGAPGTEIVHSASVSSPTDTNSANDTSTDIDTLIFPPSAKTIIVTHAQRLLELAGPGDLGLLLDRIHDFAHHPSVDGLLLDVGYSSDVEELFQLWDADVDAGGVSPGLANNVLFGCHGVPLPAGCTQEKIGIHDLLRALLISYPDAKYLMILGDDRIIPMARIQDFTTQDREIDYTPLGNLVPGITATNTTVGQAAARNRYLTDDPLTMRSPVDTSMFNLPAVFLPELIPGRLVESTDEILGGLSKFLEHDGRLDLTNLDPDHRVLVHGYDFLVDSAKRIRSRWKNVYGELLPHDPLDLIPVDGQLVSRDWDLDTATERRDEFLEHLEAGYGILSFNGHATHYFEGVPSGSFTKIQGLSADLFDTLDLDGSVIYAVGCHGGFPVAGENATFADHPLDLPQTLLRRGAMAYVANSGFGWGLLDAIGYGERMVVILTEELTAGGDVVIGDAIERTKLRYYQENFSFDISDIKTSMQWTLFGFPMTSIQTGITPEPATALPEVETDTTTMSAGAPDYLLVTSTSRDFSANGILQKFNAAGEMVPGEGCPDPEPGESEGCYYTLFGLALGEADLPLEPLFVEDVRNPLASQHGVLWKGGAYTQEEGWTPVWAQLISNGGPIDIPGTLPLSAWIRPRSGNRPGSTANQSDCRPTDTELNTLAITPAELLLDENLEPTIHRLHHRVDIELFYYNNTDTAEGNCDRVGPEFLQGPYHSVQGATVEWSVPVDDEGGVWRVVVVYDDETERTWVPHELTFNEASQRFEGELTIPSGQGDQLTYFLQAVDRRGNVSWAEFMPPESFPSGHDQLLPNPFVATSSAGLIFADGFEDGSCSEWSGCS